MPVEHGRRAWLHRGMVTAAALDHLVLVVADVERSLAWYQAHLGLAGVRVEEWRAGTALFPSLRVTADTIIDLVPASEAGGDRFGVRGHLDHVCFVVSGDELDELKHRPDLVIEDEGERFGARGVAHSIYVRDPDRLLVEVRAYPA
jgi:catechol 2,3-dioxygenase-like lactoylglutathione lyase family enzyme